MNRSVSHVGSVATITSSSSGEGLGYLSKLQNQTLEFLFLLCGKVPKNNVANLFVFLFQSIALISLSLDPSFSWSSNTKSILTAISVLRGSWKYGGYTSFIAGYSAIGVIPLLILVLFFYLQSRDNTSNAVIGTYMLFLHFACKAFFTHILTVFFTPLKCKFTVGLLADFPNQKCWDVPNVVLFGLSFLLISCHLVISIVYSLL